MQRSTPVKIFSDRSILPKEIEPVPLLLPFWMSDRPDPRFQRYAERAAELFELTSLEEADYAVAPCDWRFIGEDDILRKSFLRMLESANRLGKKTFLFFEHDSDQPIPIPGLLVFRLSLSSSGKQPNEISMPAWIQDWNAKGQSRVEVFREKQPLPTVGFCGYPHGGCGTNRRFSQHFRRLWAGFGNRLFGKPLGKFTRGLALERLARSPQIHTNFVIHDSFYVRMIRQKPEQQDPLRKAFHRNLIESDYILCVRGAGNFSFRFYETLCCGRIPVFVDTDCVLPLENLIDYKKYCVWVPESDVSHIDRRIAEFHSALPPEGFLSLQQQCRDLWRDFLSPEGFFTRLSRRPGDFFAAAAVPANTCRR